MKRRFLSILLAGCLAASLTACGGTKEESAAPAESGDSASGGPILLKKKGLPLVTEAYAAGTPEGTGEAPEEDPAETDEETP